MKQVVIVISLMVVHLVLFAQTPKKDKPKQGDTSIWANEPIVFDNADDDKDGVPNADDVCPAVAGTKENKGCPPASKRNAEFISKEAFETIVEASCNRKLENYKNKTIPGNSGAMVATTLPKTGKNNDYTVYYQTDGNGSFITVITLSNNIADNRQVATYVTEMIDKMDSWCLKKREKKIFRSKAGDSTIIRFERDAAQMIDEYMEWQVFNYKQSPTEQYVVLGIKIIPYSVIAANKNKTATNEGVYDKNFCDKMLTIYKESSTVFKSARSKPEKNSFGDWQYQTTLSLPGFTGVKLITASGNEYLTAEKLILKFEASSTFENNKQKAEKMFASVLKQIDGCGNFTDRRINKQIPGTISVTYTVPFQNRQKTVELSLADLGDNLFVVTANVWDKYAEFKKDD